MTESEYFAGEFTDEFLDSIADCGDKLNIRQGLYDKKHAIIEDEDDAGRIHRVLRKMRMLTIQQEAEDT